MALASTVAAAASAAAAAASGEPGAGSRRSCNPPGLSAAAADASDTCVAPLGFAEGHNGGVLERLVPSAAPTKPHVLFIMWDDYGWAGAGYHRKPSTPEVQTPTMDMLVSEGIDMAHSYVFYCCLPTRSSLQSGRKYVICPESIHAGYYTP